MLFFLDPFALLCISSTSAERNWTSRCFRFSSQF